MSNSGESQNKAKKVPPKIPITSISMATKMQKAKDTARVSISDDDLTILDEKVTIITINKTNA